MRTDDEWRIPVPPQRIFTAGGLRLNPHTLARSFVEARERAALKLSVNRVRIFRIDLTAKTVASLRHKPVAVDYAGSAAGARRPAETVIILRPSIDIIKRRRVISRDVIELWNGQVVFELPIHTAVVTLVNTSITAHQIMFGVVRIDPDFVVIDVLRSLAETPHRTAAVV